MIAMLPGAIAATFFLAALACLPRAVIGPSLHDRVLAVHAFVLTSALSAAALSVAAADWVYVDVALMAVLADFVIILVALKFLRHRSMQTPLAQTGERVL